MHIQVFGSSSAGNCVRIYSDSNAGVFIDAGIAPKQLIAAGARLANANFLITHEHGDHSGYIRELTEKYGCTVYGTKQTFEKAEQQQGIKFNRRRIVPVEYGTCGYSIAGESTACIPFPIIHYPAADPIGWIVAMGRESCLYMTDVGQIPDMVFPPVDVYFLEANYTPDRLAQNIYMGRTSGFVAGRTASGFGHMGMEQAIRFMENRLDKPCMILLGHRSKDNFDIEEALDMIPKAMLQRTQFVEPGMTYSTIPF